MADVVVDALVGMGQLIIIMALSALAVGIGFMISKAFSRKNSQ